MPATRFYIDADLNGTLTLEGTELHHLCHVMRIRVGEEIELVNGRGGFAKAKVASISKRDATLDILSSEVSPISEPRTILAIALMRPSKLELIIEKCTELGADAFWLYRAQHSEKADLSEHQIERLNHIAISAMKQCGRLDLPSIKVLKKFDEIFDPSYSVLFGDTRKGAKPIEPSENVIFVTGPERGFSEKEIKLLEEKAQGVTLHKNILRAETAPIAAACLLEHRI